MILVPMPYSTTIYTPKRFNLTTLLFRIFSLFALFAIFIQAVYISSFVDYASAYTEWGLTMCIIMFTFLIFVDACSCVCYECKMLAELLVEAAWCAQFVIVLVFWTLIITFVFAFRRKDYNLDAFRIAFNIEVHTLPAILTYFEIKNSGLKFSSWHKPFIYIPLLAYGLIAFLLANLGNISRYPIFDFKDWKSIPCAIFACLLNELGFCLGGIISRKIYSLGGYY